MIYICFDDHGVEAFETEKGATDCILSFLKDGGNPLEILGIFEGAELSLTLEKKRRAFDLHCTSTNGDWTSVTLKRGETR